MDLLCSWRVRVRLKVWLLEGMEWFATKEESSLIQRHSSLASQQIEKGAQAWTRNLSGRTCAEELVSKLYPQRWTLDVFVEGKLESRKWRDFSIDSRHARDPN